MSTATAVLKSIPAILKLKSASRVYAEHTGKGRPAILAREVAGAIVSAIPAIVAWKYGITVTDAQTAALAGQVDSVWISLGVLYDIIMTNKETAISAITVVYGGVIQAAGWLKARKGA